MLLATELLLNLVIRAILHDETVYPDPFEFKPERFLKNGQLDPSVPDPSEAFGFGRRIWYETTLSFGTNTGLTVVFSPGQHLARSSIWMVTASLLATFNVHKVVDGSGNVIEPPVNYSSAFIRSVKYLFQCGAASQLKTTFHCDSHPLPFPCQITPRSEESEQLVRDAAVATE